MENNQSLYVFKKARVEKIQPLVIQSISNKLELDMVFLLLFFVFLLKEFFEFD